LDEKKRELLFSYSRDMEKLRAAAQVLSPASKIGTPAEAGAFGEVIVLVVPSTAVTPRVRVVTCAANSP